MIETITPALTPDGITYSFPRSTARYPSVLDGIRDGELPHLDHFSLGLWDLDEIAKDNVTEHCFYRMDRDGCHMMGFMSYLNWWMDVSEWLLDGFRADDPGQPTAHLQTYQERLRTLINGVGVRLADARLGTAMFTTFDIKPQMELFKHYRFLTWFITETACQLWPDKSHSILKNHA